MTNEPNDNTIYITFNEYLDSKTPSIDIFGIFYTASMILEKLEPEIYELAKKEYEETGEVQTDFGIC